MGAIVITFLDDISFLPTLPGQSIDSMIFPACIGEYRFIAKHANTLFFEDIYVADSTGDGRRGPYIRFLFAATFGGSGCEERVVGIHHYCRIKKDVKRFERIALPEQRYLSCNRIR